MKLLIVLLLTSLPVQAITKNVKLRKANLEGKRIYLSNCTKCHNANPTKPGAIGPELFTTPREVFRTKVPTGVYPPSYTPKRKTKIMPRFPGLTKQVDFVYDYIRSFKP